MHMKSELIKHAGWAPDRRTTERTQLGCAQLIEIICGRTESIMIPEPMSQLGTAEGPGFRVVTESDSATEGVVIRSVRVGWWELWVLYRAIYIPSNQMAVAHKCVIFKCVTT